MEIEIGTPSTESQSMPSIELQDPWHKIATFKNRTNQGYLKYIAFTG